MRSKLVGSAAVISAVGALLLGTASISSASSAPMRESAQRSDFNGDGYSDIAIGVAYEDQADENDGAVNVIYGAAGGLNQAGNQVWSQNSAGITGVNEANDLFGWSSTSADFDGDGYSDLAVGVPYEDQTATNDGVVNVIYGSASGLNQAGNQVWSQDSAGIAGASEAGDAFGYSLASADFNGDGFSDLAVGVPYEDQAATNDGAVNVIYGSASGLTATGNQVWSQDSAGIGGGNETNDSFGWALAAGNFGNGSYADLAVGVPFEDLAALADGVVNVIYGSASKLTSAGNQVWSQNSAGIGGTSEESDFFGESLAAGDFNRNGYLDLAIGVQGEDQAGSSDGAVNVIYGSSTGLTATGNQVWSQDSAGIAGTAESQDQFGYSLAATDMTGDGSADLAIGVPGEDQAASNDGAVNVIYGSSSGLTSTGNQVWSQGSAGIAGSAEANDYFGSVLTAGGFGNGSAGDLAIGVFDEDQVGDMDGAVNVIYGSASGLTSSGNQVWSQDSAGIAGVNEAGDAFGWSLAGR